MVKPMVTMDGEWLLAQVQQIEYILDGIRSVAADGVFTTPEAAGIDLTQIEWKLRGSEPASAGDPWAWAFAYNQDGETLLVTDALVKTIEQHGKALIDGYEITLGGRDENLLNRKKLKLQGRGR